MIEDEKPAPFCFSLDYHDAHRLLRILRQSGALDLVAQWHAQEPYWQERMHRANRHYASQRRTPVVLLDEPPPPPDDSDAP